MYREAGREKRFDILTLDDSEVVYIGRVLLGLRMNHRKRIRFVATIQSICCY